MPFLRDTSAEESFLQMDHGVQGAVQLRAGSVGLLAAGAALPRPCVADGRSTAQRWADVTPRNAKMTLGSLRSSTQVVGPLLAQWQRVHAAWSARWDTLQRATWGVDAPELYTERGLVSMVATAVAAAFPTDGLAISERPVPKQTVSGSGLLDLWMAIEQQPLIFDYATEFKPHNITILNGAKAASAVFNTARAELTCAQAVAGGGFATYMAGACVGIISRHTTYKSPAAAEVTKLELDLWNELSSLATASSPAPDHWVLLSHEFKLGSFANYDDRAPLGAFCFVVATT